MSIFIAGSSTNGPRRFQSGRLQSNGSSRWHSLEEKTIWRLGFRAHPLRKPHMPNAGMLPQFQAERIHILLAHLWGTRFSPSKFDCIEMNGYRRDPSHSIPGGPFGEVRIRRSQTHLLASLWSSGCRDDSIFSPCAQVYSLVFTQPEIGRAH